MEGLAPAPQLRLKCPLWNLFKTDLWARLKHTSWELFFQNSQDGTLTSPRGHHPQPRLTPPLGATTSAGGPSRVSHAEQGVSDPPSLPPPNPITRSLGAPKLWGKNELGPRPVPGEQGTLV